MSNERAASTAAAWRRVGVLVVVALAAVGCTGSDARADADDDATTTVPVASLADEADFDEVGTTMDAYVADHDLTGAGLVVVDPDEGIVYEHYVGEEFGPDHLSLIASSSKMITAGVLMRLHDQGVLDVDAPVADAVDWPGAAANPEITPAQLVSNSSGLVGLLPNPTFVPYLCQYLIAGTLTECGQRIFTTPEDDAEIVPPDTEYRYGGGQWQVAGAVAEVASGRSWAELVDETYVQPCGLESLAYNNHFAQAVSTGGPFDYPTGFAGDPANLQPTENPNMEGGAYVSPRDYAELVRMHLRGGLCDGGRVLSEESVQRMHSDRVVRTYDADLGPDSDDDSDGEASETGDASSTTTTEPTDVEGDPGTSTEFRYVGYGLGWWVGDDDIIEDAGAYGAVPWIDLGRGYGAYLVVEATSSKGRDLARAIRPVIAAEVDAVRSTSPGD